MARMKNDKFEITNINTLIHLELPKGSEFLSVINENGKIFICTSINLETEETEEYVVKCYGDGDAFNNDCYNYLGTVQNVVIPICHVFYKKL